MIILGAAAADIAEAPLVAKKSAFVLLSVSLSGDKFYVNVWLRNAFEAGSKTIIKGRWW